MVRARARTDVVASSFTTPNRKLPQRVRYGTITARKRVLPSTTRSYA